MRHKSTPFSLICEYCGRSFTSRRQSRFCGHACYHASRKRQPVIHGDIATIPLSRGMTTVIDATDAPLVDRYTWYASEQGRGRFYVRGKAGDGPPVYLHRLLMGFPDKHVDHISGDTLDNRRSNLRLATHAQNCMNSKSRVGAESRFKGVHRNKSGWSAAIKANGVLSHLGTFSTPEEAARVYDAKAKELHGEFAWLNFPD